MSGSTGSVVLGIVGAVIGAYVGGVSGAYYGYVIGAGVGSLAFPPKLPDINGPQLNDLKGQASSPGRLIPILFGETRFAGTVIFDSDLIPVETSEDIGGKGGSSQTSTTTNYFADFAVLLTDCKNGPITGIGRIWNTYTGEMIADFRGGSGLGQLGVSNNLAQAITVYTGTDTQLPDPMMESHLGIGNVPAYRSRSYVSFTRFALAKFHNQLPMLEFEVIQGGARLEGFRQVAHRNSAFEIDGTQQPRVCWVRFDNGIVRFNVNKGDQGDSTYRRQFVFDYDLNLVDSLDLPYAERLQMIGKLGGKQVYWDDYTQTEPLLKVLAGLGVAGLGAASAEGRPTANGDILGACVNPQGSQLWVFRKQRGTRVELTVYGNAVVLNMVTVVDVTATMSGFLGYGRVIPGFGFGMMALEGDGVHFWAHHATTTDLLSCYRIEADYTLTLLGSSAISFGYGPARWGGADQGLFFMAALQALSGPSPANFVAIFTRLPSLAPGTGVAISEIVSSLILHKSMDSELTLEAGDIDVTALTETVPGYLMSQQSPVRSCIEPLAQVGFFDGVDLDGKMTFVKRGGVASAAILDDDLGVYEYGGQPVDTINITRTQEIELPSSITVLYPDHGNDYQIASQPSRRLRAEAGSPATIQSPVVMTSAKAKQVADVLRYDAMNTRDGFSFSTSRKYADLSPTQIVIAGGRNLRIVKKEETPLGLINWTAIAEDGQAYIKNYPAATWQLPASVISQSGPTDLVLMDLPTLRDQDDGGSLYMAARPYLPGWPGAAVYRSPDGVASYSQQIAIATPAVVGSSNNALADFFGGNTIDERSRLIVTVNGALSSCTETELLHGDNPFALASSAGWEIAQFRRATLNSDGTYTLTGFLRGRKGTEFTMGGHAIGDRFVLLAAGIYRLAENVGDMLRPLYWKAVSIGSVPADIAGIAFTDTGASLKPLSPVEFHAGRDVAGNVQFLWIRRTRIGQGWNDGADVPLGENSESYELEIYENDTFQAVKRTVSGLSAPTYLYSPALQSTDFGDYPRRIAARVYQISDKIGRGYPATLALTLAIPQGTGRPAQGTGSGQVARRPGIPIIGANPPVPASYTNGVLTLYDNNDKTLDPFAGYPVPVPARTWNSDGTTFVQGSEDVSFVTRNGLRIVYGAGKYVAMSRGMPYQFSTSVDLDIWSDVVRIDMPGRIDVGFALIHDGTRFVALGADSRILTSPDGIAWTETGALPLVSTALDALWDGSQYIAVGEASLPITDRGVPHPLHGMIATSGDLITWVTRSVAGRIVNAVLNAGGHYLAVGTKDSQFLTPLTLILHSTDGLTWTEVSPSAQGVLVSVALVGSTYVAVGDYVTATSTDGVTWTANVIPDKFTVIVSIGIVGFAYRLRLTPTGSVGELVQTTDGISFTPVIPVAPALARLTGVAAAGQVERLGPPFARLTGVAAAGRAGTAVRHDNAFAFVKLLTHFGGVSGSQTVTDIKGHTAEMRFGAQIRTIYIPKFGQSSLHLEGGGGVYYTQSPGEFFLGDADWTFDAWALSASGLVGTDTEPSDYPEQFPPYPPPRPASAGLVGAVGYGRAGKIAPPFARTGAPLFSYADTGDRFSLGRFEYGAYIYFNGTFILQGTSGVVPNIWQYWVFQREGPVLSIWIDGVRVAQGSSSESIIRERGYPAVGTEPWPSWPVHPGQYGVTRSSWDGDIQSVRHTIGIARFPGSPATILVPTVDFSNS